MGVRAATPFYPKICNIIPSEGADEEYGLLGAVPSVREWLADRQFKTPRAANFTIVNKLWEVSERIEKTDIEDARLLKYGTRLEQLGVRAAKHPDKLVLGTLLVNAETSLCFDGQYFFDTDHSWGDSGNNSNLLTRDIVDPTNPTVDEMKAAIDAALSAMFGFTDDAGELIEDDVIMDASNPLDLLVVAPWAYRTNTIVATTPGVLINNGQTNIVTTSASVAFSKRITGNYFDVYRLDTVMKPYIFQARRAMQRQMKGLDDQEFKDVKFMADARYNAGYGAWWTAVRVKFT